MLSPTRLPKELTLQVRPVGQDGYYKTYNKLWNNSGARKTRLCAKCSSSNWQNPNSNLYHADLFEISMVFWTDCHSGWLTQRLVTLQSQILSSLPSSSQASNSSCHQGLACFFFFFLKQHVLCFFSSFVFISWRLITLQYCSGFCHILTWISHGFTCIPHPDPPSHLPLHPIPLGLPSAPGPSTWGLAFWGPNTQLYMREWTSVAFSHYKGLQWEWSPLLFCW